MSHVIFSPAAVTDLDNIWDYTAQTWGVKQAEHYTDDIRDTCNALAMRLKQGRVVDVREGYLNYAVGKHFIFFVMAGDGIAVIRILHQHMDTTLHL